MSDDPIEVVAHDQHWAQRFAIVERELRVALAPFVVDIENIGSTAVPGLAANRAVSPNPPRLPGDDRPPSRFTPIAFLTSTTLRPEGQDPCHAHRASLGL
jgi:hypothetical protein